MFDDYITFIFEFKKIKLEWGRLYNRLSEFFCLIDEEVSRGAMVQLVVHELLAGIGWRVAEVSL